MWGDKPLWVGVIYITTLSLFHFFRKNQQPEKRKVSFKNFFRKYEYLKLLLADILKFTEKSFRKTSLFVLTVAGVLLAAYFKLLL